MWRWGALAASFVLVTGCLGGTGSEKQVFVDFEHDEFASFFMKNFPQKITVAQGDEVVFRQFWTGEPHSITGGTLVNALMEKVRPYLEAQARGEPLPDEAPPEVAKLEEQLVWAFADEPDAGLNQTASQPCYLTRGEPRKDGEPCETQTQPAFNGRHSYYNSGLIPYEGPQGNEYRVQLADDVDPGSYWFYCNVHGELQSTEVVVKPRGEDVQTAEEIGRQARKEIEQVADPLLRLFRDAQDGAFTVRDPRSRQKMTVEGRFAGLGDPNIESGAVNEFVPRRFSVKAGDPITWNVMGFHTISFGVPRYLPIITFAEDGTVRRNPRLDPAAGGARKVDIPEDELFGEEPTSFDAGTYDGTGFWSSGIVEAFPWMEYTMRITRPGTYRYACLVHPPMVGTVEVT